MICERRHHAVVEQGEKRVETLESCGEVVSKMSNPFVPTRRLLARISHERGRIGDSV